MVLTLDQKNSIWNRVLESIRKQIPDKHLYDSFFAETKISRIDGNQDDHFDGNQIVEPVYQR